MLSSANDSNRLENVNDKIDKRTHGFKRRKEAVESKPKCVSDMIDRILNSGLTADYVLMDSWFTNEPMLKSLLFKGLDVIGMLKDIETFFKSSKSLLKLRFEFQDRSYDMIISHTTIVFTRFILLEWERRHHQDQQTLGGLFFLYCDEVKDLDFKDALHDLLERIFEV